MGQWARRAIVWAALFAGACTVTPRLTAEVESFSTLERSPAPGEVAIVPFTGIDAGSLEFQRYRDRLAPALEARGFEVVPIEAEPPWLMRLGYRVDDGRQVVETIGPPPSYRHPRYAGRVGRFDDPFFYDGYDVVSYTVYGRHLVLVLVDAASGEEVWRTSAFNLGRRPSLTNVFDALVEAAFAGFPAEGSRRVTVTLEPEAG
ncbi:MAG: DUF4136 domain-containing protein [Alphaproteobacteria bacterium]